MLNFKQRQNLILCDIGNTSTKFFIDKNIKNYYKNDKIPKFKDDIFYISVNLNSFSLAFKVFDVKGIDYTYGFDNFAYWFTDELSNAKLIAAIWVSIKSYLLNLKNKLIKRNIY